MNKTYAGIGSRTTPHTIITIMNSFARILASHDYVLRSGGAQGADMAFEDGCNAEKKCHKEIYLPWKNFNDNPSPLYNITDDAIDMALKFHPNPDWLKTSKHIIKLMARNCYQILGSDLQSPVDFVLCWTQDGVETQKTTAATGGTGQAIRIAQHWNIPVFNLKNDESIDRAIDFIHQRTELFW